MDSKLQLFKKSYLLGVILLILLFPANGGSTEEVLSQQEVVKEIESLLQSAQQHYKQGDTGKARESVSEAYFDVFEGRGLEAQVGIKSSALKSELESMFGNIIGLISSGADLSTIESAIAALISRLNEVANELDKASKTFFAILFNSFIIILREGFEAILIISALAAYLSKVGQKSKVKVVYQGALAALAASFVTFIIFQKLFKISAESQEVVEGITMLLATGVLFYVSYWLISKAQIIKWQHYIKSMVETSLKKESVFVLGFASFLAVYREGAETILFYQALYSGSDGSEGAVLAGFLIGSIALVIIFIFFKYGVLKIPLGAFFAVTSTLLYYLAFVFAGKGILELQNAGWINITPVMNFPTVDILGIYPSWEGITLQSVLILALVAALLYNFLYIPYKEKESLTKEISHISVDIANLHTGLDHVRQHARSCQQLSKAGNINEVNEMQGHLKEIDKKVHEVMGHLKTLEVEVADMFSELEESVKGHK